MTTLALSVTGMSKTFAGQKALDDVDISIVPGEIRALVGQNGCGKSTLIKVLAGYHDPDPGVHVEVAGSPLVLGHAEAAEAAGLRFVHQDLGLVHSLDVVDNLALGHGYATGRMRKISWKREFAAARRALADLGYDIDVRRPVGELAMSERTAVAIARALAPRRCPARLLVLDEPTANLPASEAARLYSLVRAVSRSGIAVLFVSHHFDEVFDLAATVTVLRDGRHVSTRSVQELTEADLVRLVVGRELAALESGATAAHQGDAVLSVRDVSGSVVRDVSLEVRAGEVVGVAGITGSGREELASLVFGGSLRTGEVLVRGTPIPPHRPDRSIAAGIAFVPAERHANAAFLDATLRENVTVVSPGRNMVRGFLRKGREGREVSAWLGRLGVRPSRPEFAMNALSGGNQQKVVLARWLRQEPPVLVLDEPTQGVDVGAKTDIHGLIDTAAHRDTAVLVLSTDHEELARLCHRVLVLRSGRIVEELRAPGLTADRLTASTVGRSGVSAA